VARLFDLFLAGHPLLPLYACAALVHLHRDRVLALRADDEATLDDLRAWKPAASPVRRGRRKAS
jgi:hypothetical protein